MRMNLPILSTPARICSRPINTTVINKYSTPCSATSDTITTASAPVAPLIMPGRPPRTPVIKPTKNAAYSPTKGSTPATNAKATASGTKARATVKPDNRSVLSEAPSPRRKSDIERLKNVVVNLTAEIAQRPVLSSTAIRPYKFERFGSCKAMVLTRPCNGAATLRTFTDVGKPGSSKTLESQKQRNERFLSRTCTARYYQPMQQQRLRRSLKASKRATLAGCEIRPQ